MKTYSTIISPVITEKTTGMSHIGTYTFSVSIHANKNQIRHEVEKVFGVEVASVRVITRKGKIKRVGKKMKSKQLPDKKIAYVRVTKGKIDLFPES